MTEPTYVYQRGMGWVPVTKPLVLTASDCTGTWFPAENHRHYKFPPICQDWKFFPSFKGRDFQVGDIIPWVDCIHVVTDILKDEIIVERIYPSGRTEKDDFFRHGVWVCVARQYD